MHELGIMMEVIRRVEQVAKEHDVQQVDTIVLQVGEIASVIPHFLEECFPVAVHETTLQDSTLSIEIIPANGLCRRCGKVYHLTEKQGHCLHCGAYDFTELSGREFLIKEIRVKEEQ